MYDCKSFYILCLNYCFMNHLLFRLAALLLHAVLNFILLSYLMDYDITGSWLKVVGFVLLIFMLLIAFIVHLLSFIKLIKTRT